MKNIIKNLSLILVVIYLNSCSKISQDVTTDLSKQNKNNPQTIEPEKKIKVTIYKSDNLCEKYITETLEIPEKDSLDQTIGIILDQNSSRDFNIVGYRIKIDEKTSIATIDFRIDPQSQRQLISLSPCEQFALFGSLRQTLINNPQWKIKDLQFLQQGKNIYDN